MLNNKSLLITGGTGSFGQAFVETVLRKFPKIKRLVIFSRDELKQHQMAAKFPTSKYKSIRYFIGDVRDKERLYRALKNIDIVIHAAALKQVSTAEYNPNEYIKTNVIGAQNLIESCLDTKVKTVIALSTDKAAAPVNLYGATKLCSDKLFVAANYYSGLGKMKFSVVRYGNVMGSRGSVLPVFLNCIKNNKPFQLTDKRMTRFNLTLKQATDMVIWSITNSFGAEIFIPKLPSFKILDLAKVIKPNNKIIISGIKKGEKLHEEMITSSDSTTTYDIGDKYVIILSNEKKLTDKYKKRFKIFRKVKEDFSYNSKDNTNYLSKKDLKKIIDNFKKK